MLYDPTRRTPRKARRTVDFSDIVDLAPEPLNLIGRPSAKLLIGLAARRWGVRAELLASESRDKLVTVARHHAMWLLRTHTRHSLQSIGRMLGDRDHVTVLNGIVKHQQRMAGRLPVPLVWTPVRVQTVLRFSRSGATLRDIERHFGLRETELWRHPYYATLKAQAREHWANRVILAHVARKAAGA